MSAIELPLCEACGHYHFATDGCWNPNCVTCRRKIGVEIFAPEQPQLPELKPSAHGQFVGTDGKPLGRMLEDALHRQFRRSGQPREKYAVTLERRLAARRAAKEAKQQAHVPNGDIDGSADG